ncbi:MAG: chorismate mutase [Bacillota bacterium]|nr:chorismate mutase [Bacillota bacterium]
MDLSQIRKEIDEIDESLVKLFEKRMQTVRKVAEYKAEKGMAVMNSKREREIINSLTGKVSPELVTYTKILYNTLFDVSRSYQCKEIYKTSPLAEKIKTALKSTPSQFPASAIVACQGTEGAYSQQACEKLFYNPTIIYFDTFRGVFDAVKNGMCQYGVLPIENSVHGSVTQVVDLMSRYDFSIVKSAKIQINHVLLAKEGAKEIKEVYSHEQALGQCDDYLKSAGVKTKVCENTAVAARIVADSERNDIAAISSPLCSELYGLKILKEDIANSDNNYTRFICISKDMEIYPGADKISLITTVSHKPGALYELISKFAAVGINISKIESRPIPGKDFEFSFYLEMYVSVYSEELVSLVSELSASGNFTFLGSYTEI